MQKRWCPVTICHQAPKAAQARLGGTSKGLRCSGFAKDGPSVQVEAFDGFQTSVFLRVLLAFCAVAMACSSRLARPQTSAKTSSFPPYMYEATGKTELYVSNPAYRSPLCQKQPGQTCDDFAIPVCRQFFRGSQGSCCLLAAEEYKPIWVFTEVESQTSFPRPAAPPAVRPRRRKVRELQGSWRHEPKDRFGSSYLLCLLMLTTRPKHWRV